MLGNILTIFSVSLVAFYALDFVTATIVATMLVLSFIYFQYQTRANFKKQLKLYEAAANKMMSGEKVDFVTPIALSKDEVLGPAYNELIKYVSDSVAEVNKSQQMIKSVTTVIDAPLVIVNTKGYIDYSNQSFQKLIKHETLKSISYNKIKPTVLRKLIQDALIREVIVKSELEINGTYYDSVSQPLYDEDSCFWGVVILFHDVTELKNYQNLQREFFTNASHELKTPITAIKGCAEILLSGSLPNETQTEFLEIIYKENERLGNLVNDLLLINRYDSNQIELNKKEFSLNDLIKEIITQTESIASLKNQEVLFDFDFGYNFKGDRFRLEQCLLNLVTNAIHYSPDDTKINLSLAKEQTDIVIKIKDEGIGIPQKDVKHIFERFYRVDRARDRHTGGTGLGLSIVKSIVEAHDGKIKVKSEEGKGTTFIISFPIGRWSGIYTMQK
jgi:two-component system phosphate regulon sensor histidine kinase PhoR